jgi:citrate synthase
MSTAMLTHKGVSGMEDAPPGLEGLIVAETEIGDVRGQEGFYHYRQYNAVELAEKRSLEDVWYLLFNGALPSKAQVSDFKKQIGELQTVPEAALEVLPEIVRSQPSFVPLDALRTAVSLTTASLGFRDSLDLTAEELKADAMRISAIVPTLVAALWRLHKGEEIVQPDPEMGYTENYLYMLTGKAPSAEHTRALEQYLISTVDHGFNSSTFTARVITSTGASVGAALTGAIGALSGPLHGAAPGRAMEMLDQIGTPDRADQWVRDLVARGGRVMGFGHRVYRTDDPRALMLRGVAQRLGGDLVELAIEVEKVVNRVMPELKPGRKINTNVEYYAGVVMSSIGLDRTLFTPTFTTSRTIGWCANILEQAANNRLIRPAARYVGEPPPQPVPDAE